MLLRHQVIKNVLNIALLLAFKPVPISHLFGDWFVDVFLMYLSAICCWLLNLYLSAIYLLTGLLMFLNQSLSHLLVDCFVFKPISQGHMFVDWFVDVFFKPISQPSVCWTGWQLMFHRLVALIGNGQVLLKFSVSYVFYLFTVVYILHWSLLLLLVAHPCCCPTLIRQGLWPLLQ